MLDEIKIKNTDIQKEFENEDIGLIQASLLKDILKELKILNSK